MPDLTDASTTQVYEQYISTSEKDKDIGSYNLRSRFTGLDSFSYTKFSRIYHEL